jgi:hypothetical protein
MRVGAHSWREALPRAKRPDRLGFLLYPVQLKMEMKPISEM